MRLATATEVMAALEARAASSRELVEECLARIDALDPELHAVIALNPSALDDAAAADEARAGGARGSLLGLPVGIKDSIDVAGIPTTCGSSWSTVPSQDAVVVARLRARGAVVVCKTSLPPFALDIQTANELVGTTNNPWDTSRSAGGSSGGSAVAVATGMTTLELGTDLAGSVRIPSHACGVYGHKTSGGIVPRRGNRISSRPLTGQHDMSVIGPLGRSPDDLALALDAIAGPDARAAAAWSLELPPPRARALRDLRVGVWLDDPDAPVAGDVATVLGAAVDSLSDAGARLEEVAPVTLQRSFDVYQKLLGATLALTQSDEDFIRLVRRGQEPHDRPINDYARRVTARHRDVLALEEERAVLRARWDETFRDVDVVVSPVMPTAARPHDPDAGPVAVDGTKIAYWDQTKWVALASVAYLPATVVPAGLTPERLPIGLQIVGPFLEDKTVLEAAALVDEVLGGLDAPPLGERP